MLQESLAEVRTLTHQGKQFRLSLPVNDHRQEYTALVHTKHDHQITAIQTINSTPFDTEDEAEMRVICSVADRAQWEAHLRVIRENRLKQLGVGTTEPIVLPIKKRDSIPKVNWTGLHTPAVSTDSVGAQHAVPVSTIVERAHAVESAMPVTTMANTGKLEHVRSLSQRELVHRRLNSIHPVVVRGGSRVVSAVQSIPEEPEEMTDEQGADILIALGSAAPVATNPEALHRYLASCDMAELIKDNPTPILPSLPCTTDNFTYQTFSWADEPMDEEIYDYNVPLGSWPPIDYVPPMQTLQYDSAGYLVPLHFENHPMQPPMDDWPLSNQHRVSRSNFNLNAEEYVPIAQAIVRPSSESHAIPIVAPEDDIESLVDFEFDEAYGTDTVDGVSPQTCDAYDGFDSNSDGEAEAEETVVVEDRNEERVRGFKFPNAKSAPVTPSRARTGVFDSASPNERKHKKAISIDLAPRSTSTPHKSPRIFKKSVALEDDELDSIIMDLSIRNLPSKDITSDLSDLSEDSSRRVSSKMFLSHENADMGLLLDKMLTAKLAGVSDVLAGMQDNITLLEKKLDPDELIHKFILAQRQTHTSPSSDRLKNLEETNETLKRTVDDLNSKVTLLEGQLSESTGFSAALQAQYSDTQLSLTRLRKELNDSTFAREEAESTLLHAEERYASLAAEFENSAREVMVDRATSDSMILDLKTKVIELQKDDEKSILRERIRCLEAERTEMGMRFDAELTIRDVRLDSMIDDYRRLITAQLENNSQGSREDTTKYIEEKRNPKDTFQRNTEGEYLSRIEELEKQLELSRAMMEDINPRKEMSKSTAELKRMRESWDRITRKSILKRPYEYV